MACDPSGYTASSILSSMLDGIGAPDGFGVRRGFLDWPFEPFDLAAFALLALLADLLPLLLCDALEDLLSPLLELLVVAAAGECFDLRDVRLFLVGLRVRFRLRR